MAHPKDIATMEARLAEHGHSIADLCKEAGIATTTWGRWKRGEFMPTFRTWALVERAFDKLTNEGVA